MQETVNERTNRVPLSIKFTPSQRVAFDAMRRKANLGRAGLIEEALAEYFKVRDEKWPRAERRRP